MEVMAAQAVSTSVVVGIVSGQPEVAIPACIYASFVAAVSHCCN
jgi:hypothetical protein